MTDPETRSTGLAETSKPRLLMCAPDAYGLKYEINPWMRIENQPDLALAERQWHTLHRTFAQQLGLQVELVPQHPEAPDMVFTANAGLMHRGRLLLARFRHPQRQVEEGPFKAWFESHGYDVVVPPPGFSFEGEGDALFAGSLVVAGYLKRSDIGAHRWIASELGLPVLSLELVDDRWYHLDTAFFALTPELVAYYPGAFDAYGRSVLRGNFETIEVVPDEALRFACNSVVIDRIVVMPSGCPRLTEELESRGFRVISLEMSEYIKSGGACKCLTLFLRD